MNHDTTSDTPETDQMVATNPFVRPLCENCGSPATYRGLHWEAGSVYVCEDCLKSHGNEHQFMRQIWPPKFLHDA